MILKLLGTIGLLAALAIAALARAQTEKALTPEQQAYVSSPDHAKATAERLKPQTDLLFPGCSMNAKLARVIVLRDIVLGPGAKPTAGAWREVYDTAGCGQSRQLNMFWQVDSTGELHSFLAAPGSSFADAALQRELAAKVAQATTSQVPDCKLPVIADTRVDRILPIPPPEPEQPPLKFVWEETWVVSLCGRMVDVPVHFQNGVKGTDFSILLDKITNHQDQAKAALPPEEQAFLNSAPHQKEAGDLVKTMTAGLFAGCAAPTAKLASVAITTPIAVDGKGHATAGAWKEVYAAEGCGARRQLNAFWQIPHSGFLAMGKAKPQGVAGVPGGTLVGIAQQPEFTAAVLKAASEKTPGCKTPFIADTRLDKLTPGTAQQPGLSVDETWMVDICGAVLDVPVHLASGDKPAEFKITVGGAVEHPKG